MKILKGICHNLNANKNINFFYCNNVLYLDSKCKIRLKLTERWVKIYPLRSLYYVENGHIKT